MALAMDPEVQAELLPLMAAAGSTERPPVGDVESRRANGHRMFDLALATVTAAEGVEVSRHRVSAADGFELEARWYRPAGADTHGGAVLYLHGGGMIMGLEHMGRIFDVVLREYVAASGVPMLLVDYRVAPEHPHPTPVEDCYAALQWLVHNASALGVDPNRVAVMGDSAGGGLAAGLALMARDRGGPALRQQILIYPMLDDRTTTPDPDLPPFVTWDYADNRTGWGALLGERSGTEAISAYAAPARAQDLSGLPDTYIDVGDLDIFRDEDIEYARRLSAAGVPTELHLFPGCPHAFDGLARGAAVSRRAMVGRVRRLNAL
ncbi:MAG: alpha/beta hydrolase [Actinomycetia bacterium]|nr:alpha/beta hydrolase [Actinomycetes bacterium]